MSVKKYFTADQHFGHAGIINMCCRKFANVDEMNEALIDEINNHVQRQDILYHLGDFGWARSGNRKSAEKFRRQIRCKTIHFIRGNHDEPSADDLFTTAADVREMKIQGHPTWLAHYPHAIWPKSHHGSFHLYGHTHYQREKYFDEIMPGRLSLDVGVDSAFQHFGAYRPFSEDDILRIFEGRPGHHDLKIERKLEDWMRKQNT